MIKKLVCICAIIACIGFLTAIFETRDIFNELIFFSQSFKIHDIIKLNKNEFYEMTDKMLEKSIQSFQEFYPCKVDIKIQPTFAETVFGVLWERNENLKPQIIIYKKDNIYCGLKMNAYFLAYMIHSDLKLPPFEFYVSNAEIVETLKRNEEANDKNFTFLPNKPFELDDDTKNYIKSNQIMENEYLAIYSAAMVHYSLMKMLVHKMNGIKNNPKYDVISDNVVETTLNRFIKERGTWILAYQQYHQKRHYWRYLAYYALNNIIILSVIVLMIFFFIQFFRKNLKKIIKEELEIRGVSISNKLVYKIFWRNWSCLFYQAKTQKTRKKIAEMAQVISNEVIEKNYQRKAEEIWDVLKSGVFSNEALRSLEGNYKVAVAHRTSLQKKKIALDVLLDHLIFLHSPDPKPVNGTNGFKKVKYNGESKKEELKKQIVKLLNVKKEKIADLSFQQLHNLIFAAQLLPKIHEDGLRFFLNNDLGKLMSNQKFINALQTEDAAIIKEVLGINEKKIHEFREENRKIDRNILKGQNIIITGGRKVTKHGRKLEQFALQLGARSARYVNGARYNQLGEAAKRSSLTIIMLPIDHGAQYKVQSIGTKYIFGNYYSRDNFQNEITNALA